jgi:serine protease Do
MKKWRGSRVGLLLVGFMIALGGGVPLAARAQGAPAAQGTHGTPWAGLIFLDTRDTDVAYLVAQSVEPGSPAQAAGLQAGDSIISFNNVPIRSVIERPNQFKPGDKVTVRLRRNGAKTVPLTLGVRPPRWMLEMAMPQVSLSVNDLLAAADVMPPFAATVNGCSELPLAGAQLMPLNPDLAAVLRTPGGKGVLVLHVAPGTPATKAGLRSGDVVLRADSIAIESPLTLAKAMREAKGRALVLKVQRGGETRVVSFRW